MVWRKQRTKNKAVSKLLVFFMLLSVLPGAPLRSAAANPGDQGPEVDGRRVRFVYETADEAVEKVQLAGSMTEWQSKAEELTETADGVFELEKELSPGSYEYKFILNGDQWINDPANANINDGGNNVLFVAGLADKTGSIVKGEAQELPEFGEYYTDAGQEPQSVEVTYSISGEAEGLKLEGRTLTVEEAYAGEEVTLEMSCNGETAYMRMQVVGAQYTYTIYYMDSAHSTTDSADLWIWENNGAGATEGQPFQEACVLEDGNTWLKASCVLPYTDLGIIPRSKGAWDWQSATVNYVNANKAPEVTLYIVADDSTAYTELPEIQDQEERHLLVEYQREDGDYDGWNIYTWNSGFGSDVQIDPEKQGDTILFDIPIKPSTASVSFVMRKGPQENPFENKDGGDHNVETPQDQRVIRAVFEEGKGIQYVYPYNMGYELDVEADEVHFYYRDDECFLNSTAGELEGKVYVETDGKEHKMQYDEDTGRFVYTQKGIQEGEHLYRYLVAGESMTDAYNDHVRESEGITYSVYEYRKFDARTSAEVTPSSVVPSENAVLKLELPEADGLKVEEITVDASSIGGKSEMEVSPQLGAVTLSVPDTLAAGTYQIPVCVKDQYGNIYRSEASLAVEDGSSDWDEAVIYFMVTDRFYDGNASNNGENYDPEDPGMYHGGDFAGVTEKLDYLEELGINTIWITPIVENISQGQSTGNEDVPETVGYHGYWAEDFTKLDSHLGTEEELHALIEAAHARDIKIMVDVVLNHAGYGTEEKFQDMLRDADHTVAGDEVKDSLSGLPDFATENEEVRDQLIDWQTAWVSKFDIDYFRVDTVKHVEDTTWQAFKNALAEIDPEFKMIGEYSGGGYTFDGGQLKSGQMDSILDFDFNNTGLDLVSGNLEKVENFLENRNASMSSDATLGSFLSSHDEDGLLYDMIHELGIEEEEAWNLMKVAASMQITAKGQPVIYYGEELGQTGANDYPYQTNRYDLDWDTANEGNDMLSHYKALLRLREDYSEIYSKGDRTQLYVSEENGVLVFDRSLNGQHLITGLNISDEAQEITVHLPEGVQTVSTDLYQAESAEMTSVQKNTLTIRVPAAAEGGTAVWLAKEKQQDDAGTNTDGTDGADTDGTDTDGTGTDGADIDSTDKREPENHAAETGTGNGGKTVKTGDNNYAAAAVVGMVLAAGAAGAVMLRKRHSR